MHRDGQGGWTKRWRVESSGGRTNKRAADDKRMSSLRRRKLLRFAVSGKEDWATHAGFRTEQEATDCQRGRPRREALQKFTALCAKYMVAFYSKSFSRHSNLVDVACAKISAKVIKIILRTVVISFVFIFRSLYNDFVCGSR